MNKYITALLMGGLISPVMAQQEEIAVFTGDSLPITTLALTNGSANIIGVSGVGVDVLEKSPQIDPSKALYGRIAGLNVYQGQGPSADNYAVLSIHGNAPLVLIDGFPRSMSDITVSEIASVTVLKDAVATALYGVRGANGVVLVTTKRGDNAPLKVSAKYQFGLHSQFRSPKFADAYTYAQAQNTALQNDGLAPKYNEQELFAFKNNLYPEVYPNVNWWDESYRKLAENHRLNLTFDGGNDRFRYYSVVDYMFDRGLFKFNQSDNRYNTKQTDTRLSVRSNLDVNVTSTTYLKLGITGKMMEVNQPNCNDFYSVLYKLPSAAFPVKTGYGIYGGSAVYGANNPVALLMDTGNRKETIGTLLADLSLQQDLGMVLKGLSADVSVSFDNVGSMFDSTSKEYRYQDLQPSITEDGTLTTRPIIYGRDSEVLAHSQNFSALFMRSDLQARVAYQNRFGDHQVGASAVYEQQAYTASGRNNSIKRQSVLGAVSYNYLDRYIVNGVVNYSGSGYLEKDHRFHVYPAVNAAWNVTEEAFMKSQDVLNNWQIYASYGLSGYDGNLSHELYRQSYGGANAGGYFFTDNISEYWGQAEGNLPVENLVPEKSRKVTVGTDMRFLKNRLAFNIDGFFERRSDVLVSSSSSVSGIIGIGVGLLNAGVYDYKGFDAALAWNDKKGDWAYNVYANGSYLNSKIVNDNQEYQQYDYLYRKGNRVGQCYGLEVTGIFQNQMEINNSPVQTFSTVRPGDLKYKDQNGDNKIDDQDRVRMFGSSIPRFYFGFGFDVSYKRFDLSAEFQGMTGVTVNLLNSPLYKPLVNNGNISDTFLDNETPWSPENAADATAPRLTTQSNENNYRQNSMWYKDGSFLKLRNLQLSYTLPKDLLRYTEMKVYIEGTNLFSLDNLGNIDPEQINVNYPSLRSYWIGAKFFF